MHDFAIIGAGAAGLHLALALLDEPLFEQKSLVIIEPDSKTANDRTFCFWEKGAGRWDSLLEKSWQKGRFFEPSGREIRLEMGTYRYKMLRSAAFYAAAKAKIAASPNAIWLKSSCLGLVENAEKGSVEIICADQKIEARQVFDSRMPSAFSATNDGRTRLLQSFKGWIVRTDGPRFDPDDLILMDYRLPMADETSFFYVMPLAADRALVEFTLFADWVPDDASFEKMLRAYVERWIGGPFEVLETEFGAIPMTDFPFEHGQTERVTRIGTAGGWVKPSSGYSFKNCERNAQIVVENLKTGQKPSKNIAVGRGRFYDALLLDILKRQNRLGPSLFAAMFRRNRTDLIFSFLDETTSLFEEIQVTTRMDWPPFLRALGRRLVKF